MASADSRPGHRRRLHRFRSRHGRPLPAAHAQVVPDAMPVSPRMLYEMARRYDEWPGEEYSGSSARGAMKGWHKHGVCSRRRTGSTTASSQEQAGKLYRRARRTRCAGRSAPTSASTTRTSSRCTPRSRGRHPLRHGQVHEGWEHVGATASSTGPERRCSAATPSPSSPTTRGFWIQNSWADDWGKDGFAQISLRRLARQRHRRLGRAAGRAGRCCARASRCRAASAWQRRARAVTCSATCVRTSSASATTDCSRPTGRTAHPKRT